MSTLLWKTLYDFEIAQTNNLMHLQRCVVLTLDFCTNVYQKCLITAILVVKTEFPLSHKNSPKIDSGVSQKSSAVELIQEKGINMSPIQKKLLREASLLPGNS